MPATGCVQSDVVGIFVTHQHALMDPRLRLLDALQRVYCCRMEVLPAELEDVSSSAPQPRTAAQAGESIKEQIPWLTPTFRVLPGVSYDSLALQVACQEVPCCAALCEPCVFCNNNNNNNSSHCMATGL